MIDEYDVLMVFRRLALVGKNDDPAVSIHKTTMSHLLKMAMADRFDEKWYLENYKDVAEATMIPPGWYGWMHHLRDEPEPEQNYTPREWEKPHHPNRTGTAEAYRPQGSIFRPDPEAGVSAGYDAWTPGGAAPR